MGSKATKAARTAAAASSTTTTPAPSSGWVSPRPVLHPTTGDHEVTLVSRLTAPTLLRAELHHLHHLSAPSSSSSSSSKTPLPQQEGSTSTSNKRNKKREKNKKDRKKNKKEEVEQVQAKAPEKKDEDGDDDEGSKKHKKSKTLEAMAERWARVEERLLLVKRDERQEEGEGKHQQSTDCLFLQLPAELTSEVLLHLDYQSLLALAQTCARAYAIVHTPHNWERLLAGMLPDVQADVEALKKKHEEASLMTDSSASVSSLSRSSNRSIIVDTTRPAAAVPAEEAIAAAAEPNDQKKGPEAVSAALARAFFCKALYRPVYQLTGYEEQEVQDVFDPQAERLQACVSVRYFSLPKAFYALKENAEQAVAQGLTEMNISMSSVKGVPRNTFHSDAWSFNPLVFISGLEPVTSVEQLEKALAGFKELQISNYSGQPKKAVPIHIPTGQEALKAFGSVVGSEEILLWRDLHFEPRGHGGLKLVVVGGGFGAVVQWEYYSNYCGGPYDTFSCGMG